VLAITKTAMINKEKETRRYLVVEKGKLWSSWIDYCRTQRVAALKKLNDKIKIPLHNQICIC
jgi:hypothetical protein